MEPKEQDCPSAQVSTALTLILYYPVIDDRTRHISSSEDRRRRDLPSNQRKAQNNHFPKSNPVVPSITAG